MAAYEPVYGNYKAITKLPGTLGSLRWWTKRGGEKQVKGAFVLEGDKLPTFKHTFHRVRYTGFWAHNEQSTEGTLMLPLSSFWKVSASKVRSDHAKARVVILEFEGRDGLPLNTDLQKIQITIPFTSNGKEEKEFVDAFVQLAPESIAD